jgi:hypothetical protein
METSLRFGVSAALVLIMGAACFGQQVALAKWDI